MPQPLAFLNDEEMHGLNDLGLPNQRRWLNHRTLGDEHRRTFPSAATDSSIKGHEKAQRDPAAKGTKAHKHLNACFYFSVLFAAGSLCAFLWLTQGEFAGASLLVFEAGSHLQKTVKHFGTLGATRGKL